MSAPVAQGRSDVTETLDEARPIDWPPRTIIGWAAALAEGAALAAFVAVIVITLLQVLARYVLHLALPWTEELARILFVGSMMLGIALATRRGENIVVDFLFTRLSDRAKAVASLAFDAAILVLLAVLLRGAVLLIFVNSDARFVTLPWLRVGHLYAVEAFAVVLTIVFVAADMHRQFGIVRSRGEGA